MIESTFLSLGKVLPCLEGSTTVLSATYEGLPVAVKVLDGTPAALLKDLEALQVKNRNSLA